MNFVRHKPECSATDFLSGLTTKSYKFSLHDSNKTEGLALVLPGTGDNSEEIEKKIWARYTSYADKTEGSVYFVPMTAGSPAGSLF